MEYPARDFATLLASLVIISFLIPILSAQYIQFGPCPKPPAEPNFNITQYSGMWFEVEKYWFVFEATATCVTVEYFDRNDGTFGVEISMIDGLTNKKQVMPGYTYYLGRNDSANFVLDLTVTQLPIPFNVKYPYLVLGTDYKTYTIKWACTQLGPLNMQNVWILSREKYLYPSSRIAVHEKMRELGLNIQRLRPSNLNTCRR